LSPALALYFTLLAGVVACFVLYYLAQYRLAVLLRERHPQQWKIIAGEGPGGLLHTWVRLQRVLRGTRPRLPELLQDPAITRWYRIWRSTLWLAWACLLAALFLQRQAPH
jgi:hypothetical protein